ncbi:porin [Rhizobium arsenicireducens]
MNIKSLLLGSAAALVAVTGAQAADAIVAAEPEPMEYVRVCDAFGTGYFYIPGTETCLKIGGQIRATLNMGDATWGDGVDNEFDWASAVRARVHFDARNDSEVGTVRSYIDLEATNAGAMFLREAYIEVGGFKVGRAWTFIDSFGLAGESDFFFTTTRFNTVSYTYASDAFTVGLGVDDLSGFYADNAVGLEAMASASLGVASLALYGVYDFEAEEGAIAGVVSAEVGPGTFALNGAWSSGISAYTNPLVDLTAEWTVGAAYAFKATDKLTITPEVNYYGDYMFVDGVDAWSADLLVEYQIATGLAASANVAYIDVDAPGADSEWQGFVRLTRSF